MDKITEVFTPAEIALAAGACLLPLLAAGLIYRWLGRQELPLPMRHTHSLVRGGAVVNLVVLAVVFLLSAWGMTSDSGHVAFYSTMVLMVALLEGGVLLALMRERARGRVLIGWSLGISFGMLLALVLIGLGIGAAMSGGHGSGVLALLAVLALPVVMAAGPLLASPLIWRWQRRLRQGQTVAAATRRAVAWAHQQLAERRDPRES